MNQSSKIICLASGSSGNSYIIRAGEEVLLLECGIPYKIILKGLNFSLKNVVGCLLTHSHKDHSKAVNDLIKSGINIYSNDGTIKELRLENNRRVKPINSYLFKVGNFDIIAFDTKHNHSNGNICPNTGFLIKHEMLGKVLFVTDTYTLDYSFKGIEHLLIECNYSEQYLEDVDNSERLIKGHMSLEMLQMLLKNFDFSKTKDITLIHISKRIGDAEHFKNVIEQQTGIKTYIGEPGLTI